MAIERSGSNGARLVILQTRGRLGAAQLAEVSFNGGGARVDSVANPHGQSDGGHGAEALSDGDLATKWSDARFGEIMKLLGDGSSVYDDKGFANSGGWFDDVELPTVPLCAGLDEAVKSMRIGEIADVEIRADQGGEGVSCMLLCGVPLKEPIVQHGPFVMSSQRQVMQAFDDYQRGKFLQETCEYRLHTGEGTVVSKRPLDQAYLNQRRR